MANPQKENGHLDIANEIVDRLALLKLSGSEWQILWVVWRKTWAWQKKKDWISLTQLEKFTGLSRVLVCRAKKRLVNKSILLQDDRGISFNKDHDLWVVNKSTPQCTKSNKVVYKKAIRVVNKSTHTIDTITKETNTKELATASQDIVSIFDIFREINPGINYGIPTQREAASWLIKKYGLEKAKGFAKAAVTVHGKRFAPVITTPYLLKMKLGELSGFYKREKDQSSSKVSFIS